MDEQILPAASAMQAAIRSTRAGTRAVTGHFPLEVRRQLRLLAAEQDRTMESLLAERLNILFRAYDKP